MLLNIYVLSPNMRGKTNEEEEEEEGELRNAST